MPGRTGSHQHKRHGSHQKQNKHFLKVYSPYLPLLLFTIIILVFSLAKPAPNKTGVLAYATDINSSSLLSETNEERTAHQESVLAINALLAQAAQAKAEDMASRNYWSHNTPDGKAPWHFIDQTGYSYAKAGENLAYGFKDSSATVTGWMNSPPHRENLLDKSFTEVGFGIANAKNYQDSGPETIVVAIYGQPKALAAASSGSKDVQAANTANPNADPASRSIAKIQTLFGSDGSWLVSAITIVAALSIVLLIVKHGISMRRAIKKGEKFITKHVLLDVTVVAFIIMCIVITRSAGIVH